MIIHIDDRARPCPGVERAISTTEDILRRGQVLFAAGELIHNEREVSRLCSMGLEIVSVDTLLQAATDSPMMGHSFLVRTHGESQAILDAVHCLQMLVVDTTCPIVKHSQNLVREHVQSGWHIIIAGKKNHPEILGLMDLISGKGQVLSSKEAARKAELDTRSLLMAQTTVSPELFADIRKILLGRCQSLKILDTTCHFIRNRQKDIRKFASNHDLILLAGGLRSSNCQLLCDTARKVNPRSYHIQAPSNIDPSWLKDVQSVGITGGASTPRRQLEEIRYFLENYFSENNPKGLKNRKGGKRLWWTLKNQNNKKR
ncbi:MAG TPA: 4-hydroxy-3-methylbut-2-enyl diphosphate reductase [bacterium]|nr:4-hydroxy-3-methylbut-2-enyl diphosphate reductase [bacterium]